MSRPAPANKTVKTNVASTPSSTAATTANEEDASSVHSMRHAGMWMFEYRFMRMVQDGILNNMQQIDPLSLTNNINYTDANGNTTDMIGTDMNMDMHMFMGMYDVTSKFSLMVMGNYLVNTMNMTMVMEMDGMTMYEPMSMETSGIGDTQVAAMYKLDDYLLYNPWLTVSLSLPTGSIKEVDPEALSDNDSGNDLQPYDMQLGSGSYDITTSFSMSNKFVATEVGYDVSYLWRTHENVRNYRWGDKLQVEGWAKYTMPSRTSLIAGLTYAKWDGIEGRDVQITTNPAYYGGTRTDLNLGIAQELPAGLSAELRYSLPIHQSLNGFQMETDAIIEVAVHWMYMP